MPPRVARRSGRRATKAHPRRVAPLARTPPSTCVAYATARAVRFADLRARRDEELVPRSRPSSGRCRPSRWGPAAAGSSWARAPGTCARGTRAGRTSSRAPGATPRTSNGSAASRRRTPAAARAGGRGAAAGVRRVRRQRGRRVGRARGRGAAAVLRARRALGGADASPERAGRFHPGPRAPAAAPARPLRRRGHGPPRRPGAGRPRAHGPPLAARRLDVVTGGDRRARRGTGTWRRPRTRTRCRDPRPARRVRRTPRRLATRRSSCVATSPSRRNPRARAAAPAPPPPSSLAHRDAVLDRPGGPAGQARALRVARRRKSRASAVKPTTCASFGGGCIHAVSERRDGVGERPRPLRTDSLGSLLAITPRALRARLEPGPHLRRATAGWDSSLFSETALSTA